MSYHSTSNYLNMQHMSGADSSANDHVYFSRITQQWEPVWFYATMLKKLSSFAQAIDRCATSSREMVWSHIFSLYNQPNRKCSDQFSPIIDEWCHSQSIDLSAIEIMYTSFLQIYNQYPGLFEDLLSPSQSPAEHPLSYSGFLSQDNSKTDFKKDEAKQAKAIKLSNTSLIWGNSFASSVQQFSLLLSWAGLLEKLPPNQKEAIWNTCQFFPLFDESFDRSSFRKTFLKWAGNLHAHLSHITILFGAIGFLRDKGIIKHQFFYPNSTVPVFNNGMKTQTPPPTTQYFPSSPQNFSPSPTTSPSRMSSPIPSAPSRSSSPATPVHEFQGSQPLHHFYPALSASSPHPVLPSLDGSRSKSLPFESLSLPPLSLPSAPTPSSSSSTPSTSSSRLGLLALAAFQADDPDAPQPAPLPLPTLKPLSPTKDQELPLIPPPIKQDEETKPEAIPGETSAQVASNAQAKESKEKDKVPAIMKISKRKNSCSEFHDDESKRPRTMNLSHILCS